MLRPRPGSDPRAGAPAPLASLRKSLHMHVLYVRADNMSNDPISCPGLQHLPVLVVVRLDPVEVAAVLHLPPDPPAQAVVAVLGDHLRADRRSVESKPSVSSPFLTCAGPNNQSAPHFVSRATTTRSTCPAFWPAFRSISRCRRAIARAVSPLVDASAASAPAFSNASTFQYGSTGDSAASIRAVRPALSLAFAFAPHSNSLRTWAAWPSQAASMSGVQLPTPISALAST